MDRTVASAVLLWTQGSRRCGSPRHNRKGHLILEPDILCDGQEGARRMHRTAPTTIRHASLIRVLPRKLMPLSVHRLAGKSNTTQDKKALTSALNRYITAKTGKIRRSNFHTSRLSAAGSMAVLADTVRRSPVGVSTPTPSERTGILLSSIVSLGLSLDLE